MDLAVEIAGKARTADGGLDGARGLVEVEIGALSLWEDCSPADGMVLDHIAVDAVVQSIIDKLDHRRLNGEVHPDQPTTERLAKWLYDRINARINGVMHVTVHESSRSRVTYRPGERYFVPGRARIGKDNGDPVGDVADCPVCETPGALLPITSSSPRRRCCQKCGHLQEYVE